MIWWIGYFAIFGLAVAASCRLVPLEHRQNYQECRSDAVCRLANLLWHSIWVIAAIQAIVAPGIVFPIWLRILGAVYFAAGYALQIWAWRVNYHLLPIAVYVPHAQRATSGPYRHCRHPFYLGVMISATGGALMLGQWWALYPLIAYMLLIFYRIVIEDRILSKPPSL